MLRIILIGSALVGASAFACPRGYDCIGAGEETAKSLINEQAAGDAKIVALKVPSAETQSVDKCSTDDCKITLTEAVRSDAQKVYVVYKNEAGVMRADEINAPVVDVEVPKDSVIYVVKK